MTLSDSLHWRAEHESPYREKLADQNGHERGVSKTLLM